MTLRTILVGLAMGAQLALATPAHGAEDPCELDPRTACFGIESVEASLSTLQAGAHPDLTFTFDIAKDPESEPNVFGLKDSYAATRHIRLELPPGLIGDPNVLGAPQQCTVEELVTSVQPTGGCPNGSQVGVSKIFAYDLNQTLREPVYMMEAPDGDAVARLGFIAGIYPTFISIKVRSESDYGLTAEIENASAQARLIKAETTIWGVPADDAHDTERCTPSEALGGCVTSLARPPGSRLLPFLTNPTRCGSPQEMKVGAASWSEPHRLDIKPFDLPPINGCNRLPFGPDVTIEPTTRQTAAPTGLDMTIQLPAADGVDVLEPAHIRDLRIALPRGMSINPSSADGLVACSAHQVRFGERISAECPDAAKLASTEFEVAALPRRMKGAIYLREPEPENLFRVWVVADDLGAHVKLPGQLHVDEETGRITSVVIDVPQVPTREVKLLFKSGFRAPLVTPATCGTHLSDYEFTSWAGGPAVKGSTAMAISEACEAPGFSPDLSGGAVDPDAGEYSPFLFTLLREDREGNPSSLDVTLPPGLTANFRGVDLCEGLQATSGRCSASSWLGNVLAAVGSGPAPLWVPQPGKRPTAAYLGGPYKGAPLSLVVVVPAQAGPFDLGDVVVRSAIHVDPVTAQAVVRSDPLPQIIEGIPVNYRTIHVMLHRQRFTLNPTGCRRAEIAAMIMSAAGQKAEAVTPFAAVGCRALPFKPGASLKLKGGTRRGDHPSFRTTMRPRPGDANLSRVALKLPRSAFLAQRHIRTICTRVQFAQDACPSGSIYGHVKAFTPLLERPLEGPALLRSSSNALPDLVFDLHGLIDIEAVGRIDSVRGRIRVTFDRIPDAPLSKVVVSMRGGNRGLIVNSRSLCAARPRATLKVRAQSGKRRTLRPRLATSCRKSSRKRHTR